MSKFASGVPSLPTLSCPIKFPKGRQDYRNDGNCVFLNPEGVKLCHPFGVLNEHFMPFF